MQLKDACRATKAAWALWLDRSDNGWEFGAQHGLNQSRLKYLRKFIQSPKTIPWLAGALSSGRPRWHTIKELAGSLKSSRLYIFPNPITHQLLLVGTDKLEPTADGLFRILATYFPAQATYEPPVLEATQNEAPLWPLDASLEASYEPQLMLESILEHLAARIPGDAAYLAIRSGDILEVQATWKCLPAFQGYEILVSENQPIQKILTTGMGLVLAELPGDNLPCWHNVMETPSKSWLGVPVMIGRQVIGLVVFLSAKPKRFSTTDLEQASRQVNQLAYKIESAIIFNEAAHYLQRLALLNELASSAALGAESDSQHPADEFARRVMLRLRRVFNTDWAAVLLLSADGKTLQESGGGSQSGPPWEVPVKGSLMGLAIESNLPLRVGDLSKVSRYYPLRDDLRSELAVPLKYRGKVIGVLVLVSNEPNAFSNQDEQLLVVIASQLAGLFENVRLNEETRERARNLADSVRQLQAVRDTSLDLAGDLDLKTLLKRVAQRARDLVGARGAELGLYDESEQVVEIVVAETPWENVQGTKIPLMAGAAGQIAAFGEPIVVVDYNHWPGRLMPERKAPFHAVAGVPLKFKEQVIGTLTVLDDRTDKSFQNEDVRLLELLAPQAAISIRNARLYQELETRIQAQQLAEARLIRSARLAAVGEMAAGIAHELNNPLTSVTGFVELTLNEIPEESPLRPDLELVLKEAQRAKGVVRRLLDFSRPVDDQRTRADINELIEQVLPLFQHLARTSRIDLLTNLSPDLPWIFIDTNQIKQVLINLINNALQAMPNGGTLSIHSSREDSDTNEHTSTSDQDTAPEFTEWVCIRVSDTGEGIPPDILDRIFEPFFTTRPAGKGTGLGLSVSYGIIASHHGWIEVASEPGKGSTFRLFLPVER